MFENLDVLRMAYAMADHAANRQSVIAQNIANADTPGYRARDIASFADTYAAHSNPMPGRATRPGHLTDLGGGTLSGQARTIAGSGESAPNGNSVSLETEMMKAAQTKGQHDKALAIYRSSLMVLRTSLGRG